MQYQIYICIDSIDPETGEIDYAGKEDEFGPFDTYEKAEEKFNSMIGD